LLAKHELNMSFNVFGVKLIFKSCFVKKKTLTVFERDFYNILNINEKVLFKNMKTAHELT